MLNYQFLNSEKEGSAVVFLHGFCEDLTIFQHQIAELKKHYKLLCIDLPGFGKSPGMGNTSMDAMATEVKNVLDELNIKKCILFGHSMGGYVTLSFAKNYASYLNGMGFIHSTAQNDSFERLSKRKQLIDFIKKNGTTLFLDTFFENLFHQPELYPNEINECVEKGKLIPEKNIIEAIKAMMQRNNLTSLLKEIDLPVFMAIGKYDEIIPEKSLFEQAAMCKQAEICYLQNTKHMGMIEEPEKLNEGIKKFVNRILF